MSDARHAAGAGQARHLLRMEQIDKRYPGVHALDNVDFDLRAGEVHVLLGENGAGKSTLVKILSGSLAPDGGRVVIEDQALPSLTPEHAGALGIGMVYQELSLVPALSVAENIFLGRPPRNRLGMIDWKAMAALAQQSLDELGVDIDPKAEVRSLEVAEQQLTEIARVLTKQPKIVLLDEPTSALSDSERERLFETVRRMAASGVGIVYISHHLAEVPLIGDRVTVLRDGRVAGTLPVEEADEDTLVRLMVGHSLTKRSRPKRVARGPELLRVEGLSVPGVLHDVSFEIHSGEVLGVFGLMGAGQYELSRAVFGLGAEASGSIFIDGREVDIRDPSNAIANGLGLLTRDRRGELVPMQPIPANITLAEVGQRRMTGLLNGRTETQAAEKHVQDLAIQPPYLDRPVMYLSGGNQQKVVLARWLHSGARILVFDEPTRGIDVGAKAEVFALITKLLDDGVGVLMISSEMPELLEMADRILVMRAGRIAAELEGQRTDQEELLRRAS
jgi:ribose transport system ATP-binding protein